MSNSCFCTVRSSVTGIFVFNTIWITSQIIVEFMRRLNNYSFELDPNDFPNLYDLNFTINDRFTPKISPLLMDYIFIVNFGWYVIELYLNVRLQLTKIKNSPEKIYAWLTIYYANLIGSIIGLSLDVINLWSSIWIIKYLFSVLEIIIIGVEVYAVRKYYKQQKLAAVGDVIRLKYKSKTKTRTNKLTITEVVTNDTYSRINVDESDYVPIFVRKINNTNSYS